MIGLIVIFSHLVFWGIVKAKWYLLGYKNRSFEYASLINSGLLVFFRGIFDQEVYFRVVTFYGLVFFLGSFVGFPMVIPILFIPKYPSWEPSIKTEV